MRRGDDLRGQGEVAPQILDALGGEVAVVVLPAEGSADVSPAVEGLHEAQDLEVRAALDVGVGVADGILLHHEDALAEKIGKHGDAVGLGDEHDIGEWKRDGRNALIVFSSRNTKSYVAFIGRWPMVWIVCVCGHGDALHSVPLTGSERARIANQTFFGASQPGKGHHFLTPNRGKRGRYVVFSYFNT